MPHNKATQVHYDVACSFR